MITRWMFMLVLLGCLPGWANAEKMVLQAFKAPKDSSMRNFEGANLSVADFSGADASGSSFENAVLDYANLSLANFQNTNLTNVTFHLALIEFTDFTGAEGLTAEQLMTACLTRASREDKLGVEGFSFDRYRPPEGCQLWEHIPRG